MEQSSCGSMDMEHQAQPHKNTALRVVGATYAMSIDVQSQGSLSVAFIFTHFPGASYVNFLPRAHHSADHYALGQALLHELRWPLRVMGASFLAV
jgi:hypothetical protein